VELVAELRRLDRRIAAVTDQFSAPSKPSGTTSTAVYGVGSVVAAKLLARTGPIGRFRSTDAFASYAGVAPIEARPVRSSTTARPEPARPATQLRPARHHDHPDPPRHSGQEPTTRPNAPRARTREGLAMLKRRLADVVYRTMIRDTETPGPSQLTREGRWIHRPNGRG
jgi:transposase